MSDLLDKYISTIKELEAICNEITILQKIARDKIKNTQSEKKKNEIFSEFMDYIDKLKRNKHIKKKYKKLRENEKKIYNKINHKLKNYEKIKKNVKKHHIKKADYGKYYSIDNTTNNSCTDTSNNVYSYDNSEYKCCDTLTSSCDQNFVKIGGDLCSMVDKYKKSIDNDYKCKEKSADKSHRHTTKKDKKNYHKSSKKHKHKHTHEHEHKHKQKHKHKSRDDQSSSTTPPKYKKINKNKIKETSSKVSTKNMHAKLMHNNIFNGSQTTDSSHINTTYDNTPSYGYDAHNHSKGTTGETTLINRLDQYINYEHKVEKKNRKKKTPKKRKVSKSDEDKDQMRHLFGLIKDLKDHAR
jgi:hypothetical protein